VREIESEAPLEPHRAAEYARPIKTNGQKIELTLSCSPHVDVGTRTPIGWLPLPSMPSTSLLMRPRRARTHSLVYLHSRREP
jgi:hypothetical protein